MKFSTEKKSLLRVLGHVVPVSDPKSTMPVLGSVHLSAKKGSLTASATNLEITAITGEQAQVEEFGELCLPGRALLDRVKAMPDGEIVVSTKDTAATLKAKGSARKFTLSGVPGEEFPRLDELEAPEWSRELPAIELLELLSATSFAISTDETRLHLNSLCLEASPSALRAVSTDGHRLSLMTLGEKPERLPRSMLVPRSGIMRIKALLESATGDVQLALAKKKLWVTVNHGVSLCVKTVDAQFPPYDQVIPKASDVSVELDRRALIGAVKAVSVSAPSGRGVKLELSRSKLKLTTESPDDGEGVDEIDVACDVAGSRIYGMNCTYLVDALEAFTTERVVAKLGGEFDPVLIEGVGTKREQITVLMPMRC